MQPCLSFLQARVGIDACHILQDYNVPFLETSAKSGMNIELAFEAAARYVYLCTRVVCTRGGRLSHSPEKMARAAACSSHPLR